MSMTVEWGAGEAESRPLATTSGWSGFGAWADTLDAKAFREIVSLWEHGYTRRVGEFVKQLTAALSRAPPTDATVLATAKGLLDAARAAGRADHLAVTNGMGADDGEDEWDEEAAEFDPPKAPPK